MPVTSVDTDLEALTLTVVADFAAPVARLWGAYTDPRQLERFWGPPNWPATFAELDITPGGRARYCMTGPDGMTSCGIWEVVDVDAPRSFSVIDRFADADGVANLAMPATHMTMRFEETEQGSRMTAVSTFEALEALEQLIGMGMLEGMRAAMAQIDVVLSDLAALAQATRTDLEVLDDQRVRISRVVRGAGDQVWRALTEPDLISRWMLGPDGWDMTVCDFTPVAGTSYRWAWAPTAGNEGTPFGFHGQVVVVEAGRRIVTTEHLDGQDGEPTLNDLSCYSDGERTLVTYVIAYPDAETRDAALATGMLDGMEASFVRLESLPEPV